MERPRVGVGAIILNPDKKIFLSQRGPEANNERGKWEGPGGSVGFGEKLEDAATREVEEEFGFKIAVVEMLNVCEHILPDEGQHWVSPSYLARVLEGEPQILEPEKCTAIGWFTRDEMRELPLTQTGELDIKTLDEKYPQELPDLYK